MDNETEFSEEQIWTPSDDAEVDNVFEDVQYNLFVNIKSAKNLPGRKQNGFSDSFVKCVLGQKAVYKTKTVVKDLNPIWDESFMTVMKDLTSNLYLQVRFYLSSFMMESKLICCFRCTIKI